MSDNYHLKQYEFIRNEIVTRISNHSQLILFKLLVIGALASYLANLLLEKITVITNAAPPTFYVLSLSFWTLPFMALVVDHLIFRNFALVTAGRRFIIRHLKQQLVADGFNGLLWEEYSASRLNTVPYTLYLVWLLSVILVFIASAVRCSIGWMYIDWIILGLNSAALLQSITRLRYEIAAEPIATHLPLHTFPRRM